MDLVVHIDIYRFIFQYPSHSMANKNNKVTREEFARKGGKATLKKYGKEHFSKLAKKSHQKWTLKRVPKE